MTSKLVLLLLLVASSYAQPGTFTPTGNMTAPRGSHTATLLQNGKVLIAGGGWAAVELYDPSTGTFTAPGAMTASKDVGSATLLPDGRVLLIEARNAELYDPSTGTLTAIGNMAAAHSFATLLNNGTVLMSGGAPSSTANAELYDPATGAFTAAGDYATPAGLMTATRLADGRVLLTGCKPNCGSDAYTDIAQLYVPATDTFSSTGSTGAAFEQTETPLLNGKVLFAGGTSDNGYPYSNAQLYDPSSAAFTPTAYMTKARSTHTATLLPDGTVLIAGGGLDLNGPAPCCVGIKTAESYDPVTGTFGSVTSMIAARAYHTATLLNDGRVLLAGGLYLDSRSQRPEPPNILAGAEIYTPPVLVPAPALFSMSGDGKGWGAIWHAQTGQMASTGSPAVAGEALSMYTTSLVDGSVIPPQVIVGGRLAQVLYFGAAPGYPGYYQVNFVVPGGVPPGPAVSVRLTYIGRSSNAVSIGLQ